MMKPEEARKRLLVHFMVHDDGRPTPKLDEAVAVMSQALEMRCRKPANQNICPYCGKLLSIHHNFCPDCGQALLWKSGECSQCIHNSKNWDEEPCDGCCGNHSGFEQK